jgi:hypothetical protein
MSPSIGTYELILVLVMGINCLIPIAGLVILVLVYQKIKQIEQKLDNLK